MSTEAPVPSIEEAARQALYNVYDPELGVNVMDLGLVVALSVDQGEAVLRYRLTSPSCPVGGMIANAMDDALREVRGIEQVLLLREDDPPWTADCISPQGRQAMGY